MKKERLDAMNDILTLPAIRFGLKYEDVVINDGQILGLKKRRRESNIVARCGRRYCRYLRNKNEY